MDTLRLKNYRCFDDTEKIELKPLTLLVGGNSSGKSSFIKQFPLLKQSIGIKRNGVFLWTDLNGVDFNNFETVKKSGKDVMGIDYGIKDFVINENSNKSMKNITTIPYFNILMEIKGNDDGTDYLSRLKLTFFDQTIDIFILKNNITKDIYINGKKVNLSNERVMSISTNSLLPRFLFISEDHIDEEVSMDCRQRIADLKFRNSEQESRFFGRNMTVKYFRIVNVNTKDEVENNLAKHYAYEEIDGISLNDLFIWYNLNEIIDRINLYFFRLRDNISYVQPLRASAQRFYRLQNLESDDITSDGTNLAMYLYNLDKKILKRFQEWTQRLFKFKIELKPTEGHVQMHIVTNKTEKRNLIDVGFGFSQILPILAIIWRSIELQNIEYSHLVSKRYVSKYNNNHIIVIEQPELHLHPRFINMFANMLGSVISDVKNIGSKLYIIIETHSETLIDRIGELIAEEELNSDDINVLLFNAPSEFGETKENIKYIERAEFTKDGFLTNWPFGFFS